MCAHAVRAWWRLAAPHSEGATDSDSHEKAHNSGVGMDLALAAVGSSSAWLLGRPTFTGVAGLVGTGACASRSTLAAVHD